MLQQVRRVAQRATLYATIRQQLLADVGKDRVPPGAEDNYNVDFTQGTITMAGGGVQGRARLLASIAVDPATLLWGHSKVMRENLGNAGAADKVLEFGQRHNLHELVEEEVTYGSPDDPDQHDQIIALAHEVGQLGVELHGPHTTYYTFATGNAGSRMTVLVDNLSVELPPVELAHVMSRLPAMSTDIDDLGWSLGGLVDKLEGWKLDTRDPAGEGQEHFRVADAQGNFIVIDHTRDQHERSTNIKISGIHS